MTNGSFITTAATSSAAEVEKSTDSNSEYAIDESQKPEGGKDGLDDLHLDGLED